MSLNDEWDERAASVSDIRISSVVSMRPEVISILPYLNLINS